MTITQEQAKQSLDVVFVSHAKDHECYLLTLDAVGTLLASSQYLTFNVFIVEGNKNISYEKKFIQFNNATIKTIYYNFDFNYNRCLNLAATKAKSDLIMFCNNDLIFHRGSTDQIVSHLENYRSVSPYCRLSHHTNLYGNPVKSGDYIIEGYKIGANIAGWAIAMQRSLYDEIGGFAEDVTFWYSDNIYGEQLKATGEKHALICNCFVDHLGSKTLHKASRQEMETMTSGQKRKYLKYKNTKNGQKGDIR